VTIKKVFDIEVNGIKVEANSADIAKPEEGLLRETEAESDPRKILIICE
jgi:hypothetical protein